MKRFARKSTSIWQRHLKMKLDSSHMKVVQNYERQASVKKLMYIHVDCKTYLCFTSRNLRENSVLVLIFPRKLHHITTFPAFLARIVQKRCFHYREAWQKDEKTLATEIVRMNKY